MMRARIHSGFTLLELILVMLILVVTAAMLAPSLHNFTAGRVSHNLATNLITLTHYARTEAIAGGCVYRLNYDQPTDQFWLTSNDTGSFHELSNDFGQHLEVASSIQLSNTIPDHGDGHYVQFRPNGRTDPATITIVDQFGTKIQIACASATETFRIVPPEEMTR